MLGGVWFHLDSFSHSNAQNKETEDCKATKKVTFDRSQKQNSESYVLTHKNIPASIENASGVYGKAVEATI